MNGLRHGSRCAGSTWLCAGQHWVVPWM